MSKTKKCSTCGETKELNTNNFGKRKDSKDGYYGQCKVCRAKVKKKRVDNLMKDPKYREKVRKYNKEYYKENKERIAERQRQRRQENKEEIARKDREYKRRNPHVYRKANQKYRARKNKLPYTLTIGEWKCILKYFNNRCVYCGISEKESLLEYGERLHQEHFIPLSQGGEYTHNNVIPACKSCNSSKGNKSFFEWYPNYEHYDEDREKLILDYLGYENNMQQLSIL